jgi:hypothetical protein
LLHNTIVNSSWLGRRRWIFPAQEEGSLVDEQVGKGLQRVPF